jgi:urease accessory protein
MTVRCGAALAALLVATTPARAHDVASGIGGFYGGLLHPLLVPTHTLALVGLGLCIGQHVSRQRAVLLTLFGVSLVAGVIMIVSAFAVTAAEYAILAVAAALTAYCRRDWQRIAVRVAGSWIAASAILVLALRLAR